MLAIVIRAADQHGIFLLHSGMFNVLRQFGKERVADIRQDQPNGIGPIGSKPYGKLIWTVMQCLRRLRHGVLGLFRNSRIFAIHDQRHGRRRYAGSLGNIFDGGTHIAAPIYFFVKPL